MAEALILELADVGPTEYEAVNAKLEIDMNTGEGDWPAAGWSTSPAGPTAGYSWSARCGRRGDDGRE